MVGEVVTMTTADTQETDLRERAVTSLRKKRDFASHLLLYLVVNAFLVAIWAMTGAGYFWPIWSIVGWGIGVFFHGWDVYARPPSEERIRKEMRRLDER
jgi:2TM domain-containing protein